MSRSIGVRGFHNYRAIRPSITASIYSGFQLNTDYHSPPLTGNFFPADVHLFLEGTPCQLRSPSFATLQPLHRRRLSEAGTEATFRYQHLARAVCEDHEDILDELRIGICSNRPKTRGALPSPGALGKIRCALLRRNGRLNRSG